MNDEVSADIITEESTAETVESTAIDYSEITQRQDIECCFDVMLLFSLWVCIGVLLISVFRGR